MTKTWNIGLLQNGQHGMMRYRCVKVILVTSCVLTCAWMVRTHIGAMVKVKMTEKGKNRKFEKPAVTFLEDRGALWRLRQEKTQKERTERIKEVCERYKETYDRRTPELNELYNRLRVIDELKLIVCPVPKTGSTYWRWLYDRFNGQDLRSFSASERKKRLETYMKVLVVRNPFTRLRSAFVDRFVAMHPLYINNYAPLIMRHQAVNESQKDECRNHISFTPFARYVIRRGHKIEVNTHWKEVYRLCMPCDLKYDFIGKLETFSDDMAHLQTKLSFGKIETKNFLQARITDACRPFQVRLSNYAKLQTKCRKPDTIIKAKIRSLVQKGYFSPNDKVRFKTDKETWHDTCQKLVSKQLKTPEQRKFIDKRKRALIRDAYKTLPRPVMNNLKHHFRMDFRLFDYYPDDVLW